MPNIHIVSYNSTGLGSNKKEFIKHLLNDLSTDILLLQETWLVDGNVETLGGIHEKYLFHAVCGVPAGQLITGRPYGGCWHTLEGINSKICVNSPRYYQQ